jgi:flagellar protein FlaG
MTDMDGRPKNNLAEVGVMEVNKVDSVPSAAVNPAVETQVRVAPELTQAVKAVNGAKLFGQDAELSFLMDRETRRFVVRLVDKDTRKVIRQIPAESVLRQAKDLTGA